MRKLKGFLITVLVLLLLGCGGFAGWQYLQQNHTDPVKVYPFDMVGMTEFWGDNRESYGPVTSDKIQTVFLTDTQTVSEIAVKEGQTVKKGDLLMSFDTTLSQLELERKDLEIQKLSIDLEDAKTRLQEISWMRPMSTPPTEPETEPTEPDLGWPLGNAYYPYFGWGHDGSSMGNAFVCWVRSDTVITDKLLTKWLADDLKHFLRIEEEEEAEPTEEEEEEEPTEEEEKPEDETTEEPTDESTENTLPEEVPTEEIPEEPADPETPSDPVDEPWEETEPEEIEDIPFEEPEVFPEEPEQPPMEEAPVIEEPEVPVLAMNLNGNPFLVMLSDITYEEPVYEDADPYCEPEATEAPEETAPSDSGQSNHHNKDHDKHRKISYYVIFKITEGNMSKGETILWLGVHVNKDGSFSFFDARGIADYTIQKPEPEPTEPEPTIDYFGSGYTYSEIQKMKEEQEKKIKELELSIKITEADYKLMERELSDGNIYSEIDGKILSVLDEEEAKITQQPVVKVSGGGGFYVEATVSELERGSLEIGQEVTVNDWETGMTYSGVVTAIGDIPATSSGYNGMDNPNASSYPFTVFVDESADLRSGGYVSVMYAAGSSQNGVYLQKPFVRTVQNRTFVYVRGEDGLLEERDVVTGKSLWSSYTEITEGLTADDFVAFPYGKNVRPGVPTEEGDMNDLYGY